MWLCETAVFKPQAGSQTAFISAPCCAQTQGQAEVTGWHHPLPTALHGHARTFAHAGSLLDLKIHLRVFQISFHCPGFL